MIVILANAETGLSHPLYAGGEMHSVIGVVRTSNIALAIDRLQNRLEESGFQSVAVVDAASVRFWRAFLPQSDSLHFWRALIGGLSVSVFDHDDRTGKPGIRR